MKRKTLIALAVAAAFAAPLAYADSDIDQTRKGSLITASSPDADEDEMGRDGGDFIRFPKSVLIADTHEEKKEGSESSQLIADGHDKDKEGDEKPQLIA